MKRTFLVVSVLLIAATATSIGQSQMDHAKELMDHKKTSEAISVCQSYLQSSPRDENAWLFLAKAYQQVGNLDSAEIAAKKVVLLDDEMLDGYTVLAQIQLAKKNWRDACATARAGLKTINPKQPKYPPLLVELGWSLLAGDSADAALIAAAEAKELDPKNAAAYEIMGLAYMRQGVALMAISSFEKSLEIDSVQPRVLYALAKTYEKERQFTEAARVYTRILSLDPNNNVARLELAHLLSRAHQWLKCTQVIRELFKEQKNVPRDVDSLYMEALYKSQQYKEASQIAQEYLKFNLKSPLANRAIAFGYIGNKQYTQAVGAFEKLSVLDSLEFDDLRWLGTAYRQTKKDSLAVETWEQALKDTTQPVIVRSYLYGELAAILMKQGKFERAAELYQKRIKIDSTTIGASLINYAKCMIELKQYEVAVSALKQAIALNPKFPPAYVNLGFCYFRMEEYEEGRKEFENAIKIIDTQEVKYRYELADSYRMIGLAIMLEKRTTPEGYQKKWGEALAYLKKSAKYKEDFAGVHVSLGQCYQALNKVEEAIREYKTALKYEPKNKEAINGLKILQP